MPRFRHLAAATALALAAGLVVPSALAAQASPFVGDWAVEITAGMRIENDSPTAIRAKAKLSIVAQGDSLVATLTVDPNPDVPARPPARFAAAKAPGNSMRFIQRSQATLNMNGEERQATSISTWSLTVDGDALSGSVTRELEGMMMPAMPAQPVTGTRIK